MSNAPIASGSDTPSRSTSLRSSSWSAIEPAAADEPNSERPNRAPSSSAQSTSLTVTGGVPSSAIRRSTSAPASTLRQPSSQPPFGTESMWPPISTARSDSPRSVYQSFPAASRSTSSGRSASDSASHARPRAQVSVHATRCAPFASPVSARSSSSHETTRAGWSATGERLWDDDELRPGAVDLPLPRGSDVVERDALDLEHDLARRHVPNETAVMVCELVLRDGEVRVTEDREVLETDGGRRELRRRAGRLAEIDDRRPWDGGLRGRGRRRPPERVEHVARALPAERVLEGRHEVAGLVEPHGRVGAERGRTREPLRATADGDDTRSTEELRRLHRYEAHGARRAEDEHVLAALQRSPPGEGQPARQTGDSEARGDGGIGAVRHLDRHSVADGRAQCDPAVPRSPEPTTEQPHGPSVSRPPDHLAAGYVGKLGMTGGEDTARHRKVDRVDRRGEHIDDVVAVGRVRVAGLGQRADLADECGLHVASVTVRTVAWSDACSRPR